MRRATNPKVFDRGSALASATGDREFLSEVAGLFQAAWPSLWGDIRKELASGNPRAVARNARLVKPTANNLSARKVSETARQLEITARNGVLEATQTGCVSLQHEVDRLAPYLAPLEDPQRIKGH